MTELTDILKPNHWQEILDNALPYSEVILPEGTIREKLIIRTPGLTIRGQGYDKTKIVWDDYALKIDPNGIEYNTFRTWTVAVCAEDVTITDLSIVNDSGSPESKGQEVALSVIGNRFTMVHCKLSSTQDTLFAGPLPQELLDRYVDFLPPEMRRGLMCSQTYTDCIIEGSVDFIFGCAAAVFRDCEIRNVYDVRNVGYVAAPAHALEQTQGLTFVNCDFTAEQGIEDGSIYLARPWRDYGLCEFIDCRYGKHISPEGFDKWNDTDRDKTARFYEKPSIEGRVSWTKSFS